jgi:peptide/nickel transport system permease protein
VIFLVLVAACLAWPALYALPNPVSGDVLNANLAVFTSGHLLGTDMNGNDVWARLIYGCRTSLFIACSVNVIGLVLGGSIGATGAYLGGAVDALVTRVLDVFIAFPPLIFVLAVAAALRPSEAHTILALAFFSVPTFARVARTVSLRLREQDFMLAAKLAGSSMWRIVFGHLGPNLLPQLLTLLLLNIAIVINIEGAVSYLGLGVPLPEPTLGNMIYEGQMTLSASPRLVLLPGLLLFALVSTCNLLGGRLRSRYE